MAEEHHSNGQRDLGVDDAVLQELFAKIVCDERVVGGIAEVASHPFEGVEEAQEIGVVVAAADFVFGGGDAVARGESADGGGLDRAFEVQVKLGLRELD